jgi:hypothetical protein
MRTFPKIIGLLLGVVLLAGACSGGDDEPVEIGQAGTRPTETTEATTTTTEVLTTTTLAPSIVEIPPVPEWGSSWTGPSLELGNLKMEEFNTFVLENAPDGVEPEEAVAVYLQLDPSDPNNQMLSGGSTGPESTRVAVVINVQNDDSVRAFRYEFVLELRSRDFAEVSEEEGEAAEEGDTEEADDELDSNESDSATEEDIAEVEGPDSVPWVLSGQLTVQCQSGRGHQDFSVEPCV